MNFVFIDSQNLIMGLKALGWRLDYRRFKIYLKEKYRAEDVFMFMGYLKRHEGMYKILKEIGYKLIFKPVTFDREGRIKGNCDADLVLQVMIQYDYFEKALIVSSDGDFYSLVEYLQAKGKLLSVLSTRKEFCSKLIKRVCKGKIDYLDQLGRKLAYED